MIHIASISSGLSSALMYRRLLDRYGPENVQGVFENTTIEDDDNYRFLREIERWGRPFLELKDGRTPYQVAEDEQIIPNQKFAPCTRSLKIIPFMRWLQTTYPVARSKPLPGKRKPAALFEHSDIRIHMGYDWAEQHRCKATSANYRDIGYLVDYPLLWDPIELRPYADICRDDWGLEPPRMYAQGYDHANCGGQCVKQGKKAWLLTLKHYPERYRVTEEWEQVMRNHPLRKDYALLRHTEKGVQRPMTLRELRERHEAGTSASIHVVSEPGCNTCGIGSLEPLKHRKRKG